LTFTTTGVKTLVATYHGDDNFNSSISDQVSHSVNERTLYLTLIINSH
jgi:hypothetical protein